MRRERLTARKKKDGTQKEDRPTLGRNNKVRVRGKNKMSDHKAQTVSEEVLREVAIRNRKDGKYIRELRRAVGDREVYRAVRHLYGHFSR